MGAIWRGTVDGNPFIGLFVKASENAALIPVGSAKKLEDGAKSLGVENILKISVNSSPFLGIFCAINSSGVVLPSLVDDEEIQPLREIGLNIYIEDDARFSAVGNNIACNDKAALVNPDLPVKSIKNIEDCLGVEVLKSRLAGYKTVGMACLATSSGWVGHNRITEEEQEMLETLFKVKGANATVNSGTALVGLGICATSRGAMLGESCSGYEIARVTQALGIV